MSNRNICRFFNSPRGCRFGDKCRFLHTEKPEGQGTRNSNQKRNQGGSGGQNRNRNQNRNRDRNNNNRNRRAWNNDSSESNRKSKSNRSKNRKGGNRGRNVPSQPRQAPKPSFRDRSRPPQIPKAPEGFVQLGPYHVPKLDSDRILMNQDHVKVNLSKKSLHQNSRRRLLRDFKDLMKNPLYSICAAPLRSDIFLWHFNLVGTQYPWFGIVLHGTMKFPHNYPDKPPKVILKTPIIHSHVHGDGSLCLDMLETWHSPRNWYGWSTAYSVSSILLQLQNFLFEDEDRSRPLTLKEAENDSNKAMKLICSCGHNMEKLKPWPWNKYMYEFGDEQRKRNVSEKPKKIVRKKVSGNYMNPYNERHVQLEVFNKPNIKKKQKKKQKEEKKEEKLDPQMKGIFSRIPLEVLRWHILPFLHKHELRKFVFVSKSFTKFIQVMISDEKDTLVCFHTKRKYHSQEDLTRIFSENFKKNKSSKSKEEEQEEEEEGEYEEYEQEQKKKKEEIDTHIEVVTKNPETEFKNGIILGYGISIKRNPYSGLIDYVDCPCLDYLSYRAYSEMNVRQSVFKQPFEQFLPIYINKHHGERSFGLFCDLVKNYTQLQYFHPLEGAEILFKVMNTCIIRIMNATEHVSEVCLIGYFHCFRMLIALMEHVPWLEESGNDRLTRFIEHEGQRSHSGERNIGNFLQCIPISTKYRFRDILPVLLDEQWDRNVTWMVRKFPELELDNLGRDRRELLSWCGSIIPCQLILFNNAFNKMVRPLGEDGLSLKELGDRLDDNYGMIPSDIRLNFQKEIFEIMKINNFRDFFKKLGIKPIKTIENTLMDSISNSLRRGYHKVQRGSLSGHLAHIKINMNRYRRQNSVPKSSGGNGGGGRSGSFSPWQDRNDSKANREVLAQVQRLPNVLEGQQRLMRYEAFGTLFNEKRFVFVKKKNTKRTSKE